MPSAPQRVVPDQSASPEVLRIVDDINLIIAGLIARIDAAERRLAAGGL